MKEIESLYKNQKNQTKKMAKKLPKFGVNNYHKRTPKKRPGRHTKRLNKRVPRRKPYKGQGRQCGG